MLFTPPTPFDFCPRQKKKVRWGNFLWAKETKYNDFFWARIYQRHSAKKIGNEFQHYKVKYKDRNNAASKNCLKIKISGIDLCAKRNTTYKQEKSKFSVDILI